MDRDEEGVVMLIDRHTTLVKGDTHLRSDTHGTQADI
jgi:hypothetical protein